MSKIEERRQVAFQALVDSVSISPLKRFFPTAYRRETDLGHHYTMVPPTDPEQRVESLYTFSDLQKAYAMGRNDRITSERHAERQHRRADVEYRSWFGGGIFRKMRRVREGNLPCGEECANQCQIPEDAKLRLIASYRGA